MDKGLGRLPAEDTRDQRYPMQAVLPARTGRLYRYWHANGWWSDQGSLPHCVGHSWLHWVEDGPVTHHGQAPVVDPVFIYHEAQKIDEWPGEGYDGTSVRAGAKVLQRLGFVTEYRWAFDAETVIQALLEVGPVVVGTNWYSTMSFPNDDGHVTVTGRVVGGHAYLLNGINLRRGIIRAKNSWGRDFGKRGHFYLDIGDVDRLIRENGEACLAVEASP